LSNPETVVKPHGVEKIKLLGFPDLRLRRQVRLKPASIATLHVTESR
jgi:hypothetical protein